MMDLSTGNSGNLLLPSITKIGPECRQEGAFCQYLGDKVTPKIYQIFPEGYTMEALSKTDWNNYDLLIEIEQHLETYVWYRDPLPSTSEVNWKDCLAKYGVTVPELKHQELCLVHGDPTVSNTLRRGKDLVICDPRAPRDYIPQFKTTDMGRILQSLFGWESIAYGTPKVSYSMPNFFFDDELRNDAFFWLGATAARIEHLERSRANRRHILDWCLEIRDRCYV